MARGKTRMLALVACMALAGLAAANNSYGNNNYHDNPPSYDSTPTHYHHDSPPSYDSTPSSTPSSSSSCNVCWEWTLSGCEDSYYSGDMCGTAVDKLKHVLGDIDCEDFVEDYGCDSNKIWVCGSFDSEASGQSFYDKFSSYYSDDHDSGIALSVIPTDDFCAAFPNAVVSIKSYDYTSKYDHTWSYSSGWHANTCESCNIDLTYTCPPPPPPPKTGCSICYEWALSECNEHYYEGYQCKNALYQLTDALETVGQKDWIADYGCDGSKIWVCGSFQYVWQATYFLKRLQKTFPANSDIALVGVPDEHFCDANPGAVISVSTYDYTYKYDKTWKPSDGWRKAVCSTAIIQVDYTCEDYHSYPSSRPSGYGDVPSSRPASRPSYDDHPSSRPSSRPSGYGDVPSSRPSSRPSGRPSYDDTPAVAPSRRPSSRPSGRPSYDDTPAVAPSRRPHGRPSYDDTPAVRPSRRPSSRPSYDDTPAVAPSRRPSRRPAATPSYNDVPASRPAKRPAKNPSGSGY